MPNLLVVAMNYHPEPSGTAPYTTAMCEFMAMKDWNVEVIAGLPHYPSWTVDSEFSDVNQTSLENGVVVHRTPHFVPSQPSISKRLVHESTFALRTLAKGLQNTPDLLVSISPPLMGSLAAVRLSKKLKVPSCVVVQDLYSTGAAKLGSQGISSAAAGSVEKSVLRQFDSIITINETFSRLLSGMVDRPVSEISIIRNWANISITSERDKSREEMRDSLGWSGKVVVLHAGNMGEKQGLASLVSHVESWKNTNKTLALLGNGNQRSRLTEIAAGNPNVHFMDSVGDEEYARVLSAADILLVNEREGVSQMSMPSKVMSYLATGRPILACTDLSGELGRLLVQENLASVLEPEDYLGVDDVVRRYEENPNSFDDQRESASSWARKNVMPDSALQKYHDTFSSLAEAEVDFLEMGTLV